MRALEGIFGFLGLVAVFWVFISLAQSIVLNEPPLKCIASHSLRHC